MNSTGTAYTLLKLGGKEIGGIMAIPDQAAGTPPAWGAYFTVNDVDALLVRVEKDVQDLSLSGVPIVGEAGPAIACSPVFIYHP